MSKYKKLFTDTALFSISSFGSKVLTLLLTPLYTSILTTEQYGIADLISTTINFIYPILTLSISDATLRFAFDKDKLKNGVLNTSILFVLFSTVFLMLLGPLVSGFMPQLIDYWGIFVATYFLFNIHSCLSNFVKGLGMTRLYAVQGIIHTIAILISNILMLVRFDMGIWGYLYSIIIGYLVPIMVMFVVAKVYRYIIPVGISKELMKQMLAYSIPMIPTILAWAVNSYIDKYMIIYFLGLGESGIYSVAHKIPTILTTITAIFTQAWQLSAIENHGEKGYSSFFSEVYKAFDLLIVICLLIILPFTKWIASVLFDETYYSAWTVVPFLLVAAIFSSLSGLIAAAFRAEKATKGLMKSVLVGAIINLLLNAFLIPWIGIIGAAIATAVSFAAVWLVRIIDVNQFLLLEINKLKTVITYSITLVLIVIYTWDASVFWSAYIFGILFVVCLNFKDIRKLFNKLLITTKRILHIKYQ